MTENAPETKPKGEILVIDDDPTNLQLLYSVLTEEGYVVRPASNGPLSLKAVSAKAPDLILLDVRMPRMDGFEVCQKLKEQDRIRDIPVIFVSGADDTIDKTRGFELGGVDYITKPFEASEVLARVNTHLVTRATQAALAKAKEMAEAINEVLAGTLNCDTEEELGRTCLAVAERITGSGFGYILEIDQNGHPVTIAVSNPACNECIAESAAIGPERANMPVREIDRDIMRLGKSRIVGEFEPAPSPHTVTALEEYPVNSNFLGVPLKRNGEIFGMIGLANKENGYETADREAVETLSVAIVAALNRKRADLEVRRHREHLAELVDEQTASLKETNARLLTEISERREAEQALEKARNYIKNIIDSMPSVLIGVNSSGCITQLNKTAEQESGFSAQDAYGRLVSEIFHEMESEMDTITESISDKESKQRSQQFHQPGGTTKYRNITVYPLITNGVDGAVIRIDDVTEQVRMQELMIQNEKMLSVGGLAAGMAHEINNPLAGMMQTADVIHKRLTDNTIPGNIKTAKKVGTSLQAINDYMSARDILPMLEGIKDSGRRVSDIVENMLSFARTSSMQATIQDMSAILDKTLQLAATDFDLKRHYDFKQIKIVREYDKNTPPVTCQATKLQQVLLNILSNGAQAMQQAQTENPQFIIRTEFERERGIVRMEIEDNGPGMDEETRRRSFEPFFTTKPVGEGTGLGLSVSYFIITENHGGEMSVESEPGSGAKFIIHLPVKGKDE